jgi:hypothetical protein
MAVESANTSISTDPKVAFAVLENGIHFTAGQPFININVTIGYLLCKCDLEAKEIKEDKRFDAGV